MKDLSRRAAPILCCILCLTLFACTGAGGASGVSSDIRSSSSASEPASSRGAGSVDSALSSQAPSTADADFSAPDYPYFEKIEGHQYTEPIHIRYPSKETGTDKHAAVLLPTGYTEGKRYPVLYLLHGLDGSENSWMNMGAGYVIQNLHDFENVPEMIVVAVNCLVNPAESEDGLSPAERTDAYDKTREDLIGSLMPYINQNYAVRTGKDSTAIAGYSFGGREALFIAFTNQAVFGYAAAFSTANIIIDNPRLDPPLLDGFAIDPGSDGFRLILMNTGTSDSVVGSLPADVDQAMTQQQVEHLYYETDGGHEPSVWLHGLYNFAKRLFPPQ